jgi:hypothetical protein
VKSTSLGILPAPDKNQDHLYCPHCPLEPLPKDYKGSFNSSNSINIATSFYATTLILNLTNRTRYLKAYWPKKWHKPALAAVKKP